MATTLPIIADGILSSDWSALVLSSVDSVQDYAENGCSTDLSYGDAERVRNACRGYLADEGRTANTFFHLVTEPLSDAI